MVVDQGTTGKGGHFNAAREYYIHNLDCETIYSVFEPSVEAHVNCFTIGVA